MNFTKPSRIVVTGMGCVTALGADTAETWKNLCEGKSARKALSVIPVEGCRVKEAAEADLPELEGMSEKELGRLSRSSRLALPAVREALAQAGLLDEKGRSKLARLEMSMSTSAGGMEKGEEFLKAVWSGRHEGQAACVARYQAQQQTAEIQRYFGFDGPTMIVANACAGGGNAIGHGKELLETGCADIVLAGAYEALCELVFTGFDCLQALSPDVCRPFDVHRNGLMLGEGAGFLVLETEERARNRGAEILGYVSGYGMTTDLGHLTQPAPDGAPLEQAICMALADAEESDPLRIGYINAHGTATPLNDGAEAGVLGRLFGSGATKISSTKAAIGHTLGAAGAIEAIFCLMALKSGCLPPQIHVTNPEPAVAGMLVELGAKASMTAAMSVNLGFGGSNTALLFSQA